MKRTIKYYRIIWLKHDLPAGLSVFLVALPLCLGIALASGAPVYSGLLSGIIGGILVALISGSALGVSGPAAGLTTLVSAAILSLGDFSIFLSAIVVAGAFQIILGLLKLGILANYFPSSVIKGMLAAIGILLLSKQIPLVLGYDQPDFWTSGFPELFSPDHFPGNLSSFNEHISRGAMIIAGASFAVAFAFRQKFAKRFQILPVPLLVVITGILTNWILQGAASSLSLKETQTVSLPENVFGSFVTADLTQLFSNPEIWKYGIMIGMLATLETLLCVEAVDKMDKRNRITPPNRELIAQGAGNIACGLLGAIPITAVVVRGAANVDAGGRTRLSAFTHGFFLLLAVLLIPGLLNKIPYASLAVILLITGYNLAKPALFISVWKLGWKQFLPFVLTIVVILSTDLLIGVSIGLLISIYFIIQNNFKAEYQVQKTTFQGIETYVIKLNSNVTFLNKVNLKKSLDQIPEYSNLTIDGSACNFIDYDILEIISAFSNKAHDRHIALKLIGISVEHVVPLH